MAVDLNFGNQPRNKQTNNSLNQFNWGAFFFIWIWGIFNRVYITLIFIPIVVILSLIGVPDIINSLVSLGLMIWFGIRGNEWAYENKDWSSLEDFHRVQRIWVKAWFIFIILFIIYVISMKSYSS